MRLQYTIAPFVYSPFFTKFSFFFSDFRIFLPFFCTHEGNEKSKKTSISQKAKLQKGGKNSANVQQREQQHIDTVF